ncbi:MAG: C45 family autoproteolytic acyltransferase/hydrolase, partial [Gemmataceae bacterium]
MRRLVVLCLCLAAALAPAAGPAPFQPDPRTVQRHGPGYRYPQAGWVVLHIEGEPYERGVQHGRLLAPEIAAHLRCYSAMQSPKAPEDAWRHARTLAHALFLRGYTKEYLEEMKGIADGASAAGARLHGRRIDLLDIVTLNSWPEEMTLDGALRALPAALDGLRFPLENPRPKAPPKSEHCSAFAATGPATRDGKVVFGHITMFSLYPANFYNVWLDVKPARGRRVLMQAFPGGIHSGMDYYQNDAGLLISETTIGQTRFDRTGLPLASRIRHAMQYGETIDQAVAILNKGNNGLYSNEWLLADTKTNEIAMFELGTHKTRLWRSSKDEWFGGTRGFYWGCNNTKDLDVRLETMATTAGRPGSTLFVPSTRDQKWIQLFERYNGKMDAEFARLAFTTPPLAAFSSVDAKFTTTDLAKDLRSWAIFGPPLGRTWEPTFDERSRFAEVRPLVSNPWTVLGGNAPPTGKPVRLADLHDPERDKPFASADAEPEPHTGTAWRGTVLAKTDADLWLAAAFPAAERLASLERALAGEKDGKLSPKARDRLAVERHAYRALYEGGVRGDKDVPLARLTRSLRDSHWHELALGKGTLFLDALRAHVGGEAFDAAMDGFGVAHAGKEVTTAEFQAHLERATGRKLAPLFGPWLNDPGLPSGREGGPFTVSSFYPEVEQALIVYGTADEEAANREAAEALQQALRRRGANVTVPVRSDREAGDEELKGHHLLLIGRPTTNRVTARFASTLPVTFASQSMSVRDEAYAHPDTAALVAAENPLARRY